MSTPQDAPPQPPQPATNTPDIPIFGEQTLRAQLPNILTTARVALTIAFAAILTILPTPQTDSHTTLLAIALALFIIAAVTDALDGYLARKWNAISIFGRVMDPFADKALILTAFILLPAVPGSQVAPWMTALIVARELLITSIRGVCESQGIDFSASTAGKLKMIAQSIAVPAILLLLTIDPAAADRKTELMNAALAYTATFITAWSAIPYITRATSALRNREQNS